MSVMIDIYREVTLILVETSNSAYYIIKKCKLMYLDGLTRLAHEVHNPVPLCPKFSTHMKLLLNDLKTKGFSVDQLRNLIEDLYDTQSVIDWFGCYRHWGHPFIFIKYEKGVDTVFEYIAKPTNVDLSHSVKKASLLA